MIRAATRVKAGVRHRPEPAGAGRRGSWLHDLPFPLRAVLRRWRGMLGMMLGVGLALGLAMTLMATSRASVELLVGDYRVSGRRPVRPHRGRHDAADPAR